MFGVLVGIKSHYSVKYSKNEFVKGIDHINRTESFWDFSKIRLSEFKEIDKSTIYSI
ncbi:hypothetical protein Taitung42_14200 [Helicobacter pylori]